MLDRYSVVSEKEERLKSLADPAFRPRERVILETEPNPKPVEGGAQGTAQVRDETTDSFVVDVVTPGPAILLITDSYASDWHATPAVSGPQAQYEILPANHALRAIPVVAGEHHIRLEYAPRSASWGLAISIVSVSAFVMAWILRQLWVVPGYRRRNAYEAHHWGSFSTRRAKR